MKIIGMFLLCLFFTGCATPLTETQYQQLTEQAANLERCFEERHVDPKFYSDSKRALAYYLDNNVSYDQAKFDSMRQRAYLENKKVSSDTCRIVEANYYDLIAQTSEDKANYEREKARREALEDAEELERVKKEIVCKTVGKKTICR